MKSLLEVFYPKENVETDASKKAIAQADIKLRNAISSDNAAEAKEAIENGARLHKERKEGYSLLKDAIVGGKFAAAEVLMYKGAPLPLYEYENILTREKSYKEGIFFIESINDSVPNFNKEFFYKFAKHYRDKLYNSEIMESLIDEESFVLFEIFAKAGYRISPYSYFIEPVSNNNSKKTVPIGLINSVLWSQMIYQITICGYNNEGYNRIFEKIKERFNDKNKYILDYKFDNRESFIKEYVEVLIKAYVNEEAHKSIKEQQEYAENPGILSNIYNTVNSVYYLTARNFNLDIVPTPQPGISYQAVMPYKKTYLDKADIIIDSISGIDKERLKKDIRDIVQREFYSKEETLGTKKSWQSRIQNDTVLSSASGSNVSTEPLLKTWQQATQSNTNIYRS